MTADVDRLRVALAANRAARGADAAPAAPAETALVVRGRRVTDPTKITPAGLEQIERDAALGLSTRSIATNLGIPYTTFRDLRNRDESVEDALQRGLALLEDEVVDLLLRQGRKGNTTALIWLTKNRLGWKDSPAVEMAPVNVQIVQLPAAATESDYLKQLPETSDGEAEIID
jgi:hypothetical protein